jgi:CO/xanthine dehydrogenase Mo-binding subunit
MSQLGTELTRPDAKAKLSGAARYTQDFYPPGVLHAMVVTSDHAAAALKSIDTSRAEALPGVAAVLTAQDVPDRRYGIMNPDEPMLARDAVRYIGEPIALVAAESKAIARAAAEAISVEYDVRPEVVELAEAIRDDAPRVHAGDSNILMPGAIVRGDAEAIFASARIVVETAIASHRAHQAYLEPRASLAELDDNGRLIVTTSSQAPYEVRTGLCELLDLPASRVRVKVPALGGGFGGKLHLGMAPYAAALCLHTRRPVQLVCSREAEMQSPAPRENSLVTLKSACDEDGRILAREATIYLDSGAYAYDTPALTATAALQASGPYDIETVAIHTASVYTNSVPTGSFRAPTGPQMAYANEAHLEDIAERLGRPSVELRRRNIVQDGSLGPSGQRLHHPGMATCLDRVCERVGDWRAENGQRSGSAVGTRRGIGLACAWWSTFPGRSAAIVTMNEDGGAVVQTGATEIGTGAVNTAVTALVADELGLDMETVRLASGDTDGAPFDFGSQGSRTMYAAGSAAKEAAGEVRQILCDYVAFELEANPEDLAVADGRITVKGSPSEGMSIAEAVGGAAARSGPVVASARFQPVPPTHEVGCVRDLPFAAFNEPTYHCHAAEIEIDDATGRLRVLRYLAAHDLGPVLNPAGVRGQIEGGVVQGIGYALFEEIQRDAHGRTLNASLVDYRLPTIADIPDELEVIIVSEHPGKDGPQGAKGIGEAPIILPAAALGAAVRDATGSQPNSLPLSAEKVSALIRGGSARAGGT